MGIPDSWWALIPILNIVFFLKFIGKPIWWIVLFIIPIVGTVIAILCEAWLVAEKVAKKAYGKSTGGFAVGLLLLGFIFYAMLGFGSDGPQQTGNAA